MEYKKKIVRRLAELTGAKSWDEVFCDWVKCSAITIQNSCTIWKGKAWEAREREFEQTIAPYGEYGKRVFGDALANLALALEREMSDVLGEIYMESGMGNKRSGQFFTPFSVSYMMARMALKDKMNQERIWMHEPACGSGGMIIATAKVLMNEGKNYQRKLRVMAQDLDWKAVYMCYVQCSLLGIWAEVAQGDVLLNPHSFVTSDQTRVFLTPRKKGVLM